MEDRCGEEIRKKYEKKNSPRQSSTSYENAQHRAESGVVSWCLLGAEQEGPDDVANSTTGVAHGYT